MRRIFFEIMTKGSVLLCLFVMSCDDWNTTTDSTQEEKTTTVLLEKDLSYKGRQLIVTKHARCRMDCRNLDAYEVQEVINMNRVNERKSKPASNGRCESIAYEGRTRDGQQARIIVGNCDDNPIVITVIDLDTKYHCTCN